MALPEKVKRWAFYNFANHSYQVVYVAFLLPVFFSTILLTKGFSLGAWGAANGLSTVIGVVIAIVVGKYSDHHSKLKAFQWSVAFTFFGMLAVALLSAFAPRWIFGPFIATNAFFIWSLSLSDSILPHLSDGETAYEYGGFAWGFGYVGGIASLLLVLILQRLTGNNSLTVFLSVPLFYAIFSWYSLTGLKRASFRELAPLQKTVFLSKSHKGILFLGYWLISECITVISLFASLYLSGEMHFLEWQVGVAFLFIQLVGFPATWLGGRLVRRYATLKLLGWNIVIWGVALMLFLSSRGNLLELGVAIFLMGLVYGNTQSYLRSQYATLIQRSESGFQFGIYSIVSEAAVFIGPIVFGYASDTLHSQRIPMFFLFGFMALGYGLIWKIMHGKDVATAAS